uniref:Transmembrane BAX inhibitor motif containing 1b n=1 Tax=Neolamprologus brichardi TaxID=32507 RepID=A0A3Q4N3U0_NEOBR
MTSKIDSPPPYEEALHHPKCDNFPYQPQHGSPLPPPPSYSPSPGYWGQGGVYPPISMCQGPGLPPSGMPTTIPTLSAGLPASNSGEMEDFLSTQWESTSVRHAFIRKVYLILSAQLAVTFSVVAVFTFVDPVRMFVISYPGIYWASFVVYFVHILILMVYMCLFFCFVLIATCVLYSYYGTKAVFIAMGVTALVCIAVTVFCFQTKVDFTSCGGLLCIAAVLLMIIGIVTAIVLSFQYVSLLWSSHLIYSVYSLYNTQLLIGNRELAISPEEYVYGALSLYVDIVHIFLFILQVSGAATE